MREDGVRYDRGIHSNLARGLFLASFILSGVAFVVQRNWWLVGADAFWIIGVVVSWRRATMNKPR